MKMAPNQEIDPNGNSKQQADNNTQLLSHDVPQQPLHMQTAQQGVSNLPQSVVDVANSSSLVYDRTIKVPKMGYADHGSHGVAAVPLYTNMQNNGSGAAPPLSSVQMQLQMQQMAAMLQQQLWVGRHCGSHRKVIWYPIF